MGSQRVEHDRVTDQQSPPIAKWFPGALFFFFLYYGLSTIGQPVSSVLFPLAITEHASLHSLAHCTDIFGGSYFTYSLSGDLSLPKTLLHGSRLDVRRPETESLEILLGQVALLWYPILVLPNLGLTLPHS